MTKTPLIEKTPVIRQMLINKGVREGSRVKVSIMNDLLKMHNAGWQFIAMFKDSGCFKKIDKSTIEITSKFHTIKNEELVKYYPQSILGYQKQKISSPIQLAIQEHIKPPRVVVEIPTIDGAIEFLKKNGYKVLKPVTSYEEV